MNTVFVVAVCAWVLMVTVVLLLALYRMLVTRGSYTVLHVRRSELSLIPQQIMQDQRLDRIDWWGQLMTVVALASGLAITGIYLYIAVGRQR